MRAKKPITIFIALMVLFSLLTITVVSAEANIFKRIGRFFSKVERSIGKLSPLITAAQIIREGKQRKRNEKELNKMASQDRKIGEYRSKQIKEHAYSAYKNKKISSTQMMSEYTRAASIKEYYNKRADTLGVLARRQGRLNKMIQNKIAPVIMSKVAKTARIKKTFQKFEKAFKDFDGNIDKLLKKAAELEAGIDKGKANIIGRAKKLFNEFTKANNKIINFRDTMNALGIRNRKIERILDKTQEITYAGFVVTRGIAETGHVAAGELKKGLKKVTKELKTAKEEASKRAKEIQEFRKRRANMKPHASSVDRVGKIVANDPDYQAAKGEFFEAWLKKKGATVDKKNSALGKRLKDLEERLRNSSDPNEKDRLGYEMTLINKRLGEYKAKLEKKKRKEEKQIKDKEGCVSDNDCPQGYVCNTQTGQCVPPFDDLYAGRQRFLDEKAAEGAMDLAMQQRSDRRTGRPGFTSDDLDKALDKTQDYVKAECNDNKPCPDPDEYECVDGKCVKKSEAKQEETKDNGETPPKEEPPPTEEIVRLEVDPPEATIPLDGEVTFKAFAILRDGKRKPVKAEWDRTNPYKGEAGSDTITATYGEFSKSATITVMECVNIAGTWYGKETIILETKYPDGKTTRDVRSGSGVITIEQDSCNISISCTDPAGTFSTHLTGTVKGDKIEAKSSWYVVGDGGVKTVLATGDVRGTIRGNTITLEGRGKLLEEEKKEGVSFETTSKTVLTRQ